MNRAQQTKRGGEKKEEEAMGAGEKRNKNKQTPYNRLSVHRFLTEHRKQVIEEKAETHILEYHESSCFSKDASV